MYLFISETIEKHYTDISQKVSKICGHVSGVLMFVFCKIKTVAMKDDSVLLCGKLFETMCLDHHYYAFKVRLRLIEF